MLCASLIAACPALARGDDASFRFEAVSPQPYTPGYLGNGAIGLETTPLGTSPAHSFLAGVYDHTPGDVPRIAAAPAWNEIDFYNGSHWLNAGESFERIQNYHQLLDMYDGVLRTSYAWSQDNRKIRVEAEEFVSRARADVGGSTRCHHARVLWADPGTIAASQLACTSPLSTGTRRKTGPGCAEGSLADLVPGSS